MLKILFFIYIYMTIFPLFYIITKRFMGLNPTINAFNAKILACTCLIVAAISSYFCLYLHQWSSFILNLDTTIALSILSLDLCYILVMILVYDVRLEEYLVFLYTILFVISVISSFDFITMFVILEEINIKL